MSLHEYEATAANPLAMPIEHFPHAEQCVECGEALDESERATKSGHCFCCW